MKEQANSEDNSSNLPHRSFHAAKQFSTPSSTWEWCYQPSIDWRIWHREPPKVCAHSICIVKMQSLSVAFPFFIRRLRSVLHWTAQKRLAAWLCEFEVLERWHMMITDFRRIFDMFLPHLFCQSNIQPHFSPPLWDSTAAALSLAFCFLSAAVI